MSGFFGKLLTIAVVVAIAWFGWRWWQRQIDKPAAKRQPPQSPPPPPPEPAATKPGRPMVEDLVACGVCGAYVPAGSMHCDRRA